MTTSAAAPVPTNVANGTITDGCSGERQSFMDVDRDANIRLPSPTLPEYYTVKYGSAVSSNAR